MRESPDSGQATGLILGIESSCDETAAAVVRSGTTALSNVVASQMNLHANYGGVVPELASREHLRNIVPVVREAMSRAGVGFDDLDAVLMEAGERIGDVAPLLALVVSGGHTHLYLAEQGDGVWRYRNVGRTVD